MAQNGKGDKWRQTNYIKYFHNFDEINWGYTDCSECGQPRKNTDKEKYMVLVDGEWQCKKCNYN